jgi:5-(carboxyamino)imidazole ribonucleotide synthase
MSTAPILPGATIGVLGSGQLGRMFALAARRLGYRIHVFSPERDTPAGQVADLELVASYDDFESVAAFGGSVDVVTFEFENIPAATADAAAAFAPVRPSGVALHVAQQRAREKGFLADRGFPVTPFAHIRSEADLEDALATIGTPGVLKTASFGYDGKGQSKVATGEAAWAAWKVMGKREAVLEKFIPFEREVSTIVARGVTGWIESYGLIENSHASHILDVSVHPASVPPAVEVRAAEIARGVVEALDLVGLLCIEFFLTHDGELLINELAPRPHNSGHLTIDACMTSQFEQHVRAICGLPPGSIEPLRPSAMANLLGDLWSGGEPDWAAACAMPGVHLHLYGKAEPRAGRKMGHLTALAGDTRSARRLAIAAREALIRS